MNQWSFQKTLSSLGSLILIFTIWFYLGYPKKINAPEITQDHKLQCVSYTPLIGKESPYDVGHGFVIPKERMERDISLLSQHFSCIRIYSVTGMEALPTIIRKHGMKILLGLWINADQSASQKEITQGVDLIKANRDVIQAVIVGNETLLRKEITTQELISYLQEVKKNIPDIPVTYADVWEFWLKNAEIAPYTDYVTIHILPYWEDEPTSIHQAMAHVKKIHDKLAKNFANKEIFIGETGWPSVGRMREGAIPNPINEARYIREFVQLAEKEKWHYNLIEAFDQPWKRNNEGAVGGYWGLYDTQRQDKNVFEGNVPLIKPWLSLTFISLGLWLLLMLLIPQKAPWIFSSTSLLTIYQAYLFFLTARHTHEAIVMSGTLILSLLAGIFWAYRLKHQLFSLIILIVLSTIQLELVFDSRYRCFDWAGFTMPIFYLIFFYDKSLKQEWEKMLGILLLISSITILWNESTWNWEAVIWSCLTLALGYSLLKEKLSLWINIRLVINRNIQLSWYTALVLTYFLSFMIRYKIMESVSLVGICSTHDALLICRLRSVFGYLIYLQLFGKLGLIFSLLSFFNPLRKLATWGLCFATMGLVLYNFNLAALAFVLSLLNLSGFKITSFLKPKRVGEKQTT